MTAQSEQFPIASDEQAALLRRVTAAFGPLPHSIHSQAPSPYAQPIPRTEVSSHDDTEFSFERLSPTDYGPMEWIGTIQRAIEEVEAHIRDGSLNGGYWKPARILRGIVESNIDGPARIALVNQATEFIVGAYAGTAEVEDLQRLAQTVSQAGIDDLYLQQEKDTVTEESSTAELSWDAALRLCTGVHDSLLVIPLCHGGLVASVQTVLFHQKVKPAADIALYPLYFSRRKRRQSGPAIDPYELDHLKTVSEGRTVIVFDEDASSGGSVEQVIRYLSPELPANRVLGLVNSDWRQPEEIEAQGYWWERIQA